MRGRLHPSLVGAYEVGAHLIDTCIVPCRVFKRQKRKLVFPAAPAATVETQKWLECSPVWFHLSACSCFLCSLSPSLSPTFIVTHAFSSPMMLPDSRVYG